MGSQPNTQILGSSRPSIPRELEAPFLGSLLHDLPLGIVLIDDSGRFLFANDAAARRNGVPAAAHIGCHIREVVPDLWDEAEAVLRRVLQGDVVERQISGQTPAAPGVTRYWTEQWFPVREAGGDVAAVAGTFLEVTDEVQARVTVEHTAEMRDRLIHLTSHELRGPLTNILGYAQWSLRHDSLDEIRDNLRIIYDQAVQMRERLEFSDALSDPEDLTSVRGEAQTIDLVALVEHELSILRRTHPRMSINLVHQDDAVVQSDPHLLRERDGTRGSDPLGHRD